MKKKKAREIIGKRIQEYKLPLIERLAYYRPFIWFLFLAGLTAMIVGPTIIYNYENLWYFLGLAPLIFFLVLSVIKYIQFCVYRSKCQRRIEEAVDNDHHYDNYSGAPGTGKTLTAQYMTHEIAKANWDDLQFEYWLIASKLRDSKYVPSRDEQEIIDAYNFYINNKGVPCWSSNVPALSKRYRRFAYIVDSSHLKQEERVPYRLASCYDEIGTIISLEMQYGKASNKGGATDIEDTFRFCRQFAVWRMIGCEQDYNNIFIGARRVASENRVYLDKKWVLKPRFLYWLYNKMRNHFVKKMRLSESIMFSNFMRKFKKYINKCGYFKFRYKVMSNTETSKGEVIIVDTGERDVLYIPRVNEVEYRTRVFREAYKAKDKKIDLKVWDSLYMSDERARSMLKSENLVVKDAKGQRKQEE